MPNEERPERTRHDDAPGRSKSSSSCSTCHSAREATPGERAPREARACHTLPLSKRWRPSRTPGSVPAAGEQQSLQRPQSVLLVSRRSSRNGSATRSCFARATCSSASRTRALLRAVSRAGDGRRAAGIGRAAAGALPTAQSASLIDAPRSCAATRRDVSRPGLGPSGGARFVPLGLGIGVGTEASGGHPGGREPCRTLRRSGRERR
jgi:hypothetical protein